MPAGAPIGNKNAEVWTAEEADNFFDKAIILAKEKDEQGIYTYDFLGEIATECGTYKEIFTHLTKRFSDLDSKNMLLHSMMESNCYSNTKRGKIKEATGIINLKANHKWKDRGDYTTNDKDLTSLSDAELSHRIAVANEALSKAGTSGTPGGESSETEGKPN